MRADSGVTSVADYVSEPCPAPEVTDRLVCLLDTGGQQQLAGKLAKPKCSS